jgi:NhaA family Na+:H+ antiporter
MSEERIRRPWAHSDRPLPRTVLRPLQEFMRSSEAGAAVLLVAVVVALVWANSAWSDAYHRLFETELGVSLGTWSLSLDLGHWVNDGLMTLFFLVVGLEIKREVTTGELREWRAAALPAVAALGGMIVPALLYTAINLGGDGARGWGVPMATDIAFALGVLTLAARWAPPSLKPLLLTLAIVDDIGAILVIALFYADGVVMEPVLAALAIVALIVAAQRIHIRAVPVYLVLGGLVWYEVLRSGVHPTIVGVALGLLTPAVAFQRPRAVSEEAHRTADETVDDPQPPDADAHWWLRLAGLSREAVSPLARVEHVLLPWVNFAILPLFALANTGVTFTSSALTADLRVSLGIVVGLVIGKPIGIAAASWLAVRTGLGVLPENVRWGDLVGMASVAGIGFTMSLFIADLAFSQAGILDAAKIGILGASLVAGAAGFLLLRSAAGRTTQAV